MIAAACLVDRVVESFGGFHDTLNSRFFYNANGTSHTFVLGNGLGEVLNGVNVILAVPVGFSTFLEDSARSAILNRR